MTEETPDRYAEIVAIEVRHRDGKHETTRVEIQPHNRRERAFNRVLDGLLINMDIENWEPVPVREDGTEVEL